LVQGLTSPINLTTFTSNFIDPNIASDVNKLGAENINPKELTRIVSQISNSANTINQILEFVVNKINFLQSLIRISLTVIRVFQYLINLLLSLPMPNQYTTTGYTNTSAKSVIELKEYVNNTVKVLDEINLLIAIASSMLQNVSFAITQVVTNLKTIANKLDSCSRNDSSLTELKSSLNSSIDKMEGLNQNINSFLTNLNNKKSNTNYTYYNFTIQILTEEITDKSVQKVTIPRRYGVALNYANEVVAQSTPTFASDDNVIIQEVKLILNELHLIESTPSAYSDAQIAIITKSLAALGDNNINFDNFTYDSPTSYLDAPGNEDDNSGLGLNAFFNKQKGGKELRQRVRGAMSQSKQKLKDNLSNIKH
jgi:hypothetical protein